MIKLTLLVGFLFSTIVCATPPVKEEFEIVPLNSPVKTSEATFQIIIPSGFEIDKAKYKIKNVVDIFNKSEKYEPLSILKNGTNYEASINVSKLPPGHYEFHLKIIDKKSKKEIICKQKKKHVFKDYAVFVIDSSLKVALPDPKKDASTLEGIDSNFDGLPDRLERWINETTYSNDMKEALKQSGRFIQLILINHKDPKKAVEAIDARINSNTCIYSLATLYLGNYQKGFELDSQITNKLLNTEARIKAYRIANTHASGTGGNIPEDLSKEAACNL